MSFLIELIHIKEQSLIGLVRSQHHNGCISHTFHYIGIRDHSQWHIVKENVFVTFTEFGNQIFQSGAHQQFSRIGRNRTGENDIKIRGSCISMDNVIHRVSLARKIIGNADTGTDAKNFKQGSLSDIQVNNDGLS